MVLLSHKLTTSLKVSKRTPISNKCRHVPVFIFPQKMDALSLSLVFFSLSSFFDHVLARFVHVHENTCLRKTLKTKTNNLRSYAKQHFKACIFFAKL